MVKDHSDSEKGNLLPPHRLLFTINSKGSFICTIPHRIAHTTAFVTPVVEHWLEGEIAQWVHHMKDRSDNPSHHERTPLPRSYISLLQSAPTDSYSDCLPMKLNEVLTSEGVSVNSLIRSTATMFVSRSHVILTIQFNICVI